MKAARISLPSKLLQSLRGHLLRRDGTCEEAAFVFAQANIDGERLVFEYVDWLPILPAGFESRSAYYLELGDETRAAIIKRAHDLGTSVIEFHSHPRQRRACFSWSDLHGFDEFVPHIMWRLKGRPYAAVVFAPGSVDGLAWVRPNNGAIPVRGLTTESETVTATGLTIANWSDIYVRQPI
jgi:hypothetical protein